MIVMKYGEEEESILDAYENGQLKLGTPSKKEIESIKAADLVMYRDKLAKRLGLVALGNEVNRCRVVFHFAFENELIDKPVRFGDFKRPKKPALRKARAAKGSRLFDPADLRRIIEAAGIQMKAMVLLAINAGLGNSDCGQLPIAALDLARTD